jgi:hypothetical protein
MNVIIHDNNGRLLSSRIMHGIYVLILTSHSVREMNRSDMRRVVHVRHDIDSVFILMSMFV